MVHRRVHYIDWLRVLAVLLLFPFHTGRVFNFGEPFYAKSAIESVPLAYLIGFIGQWHMPLLFFLAGMSSFFALKRRTLGQYAKERTSRLLVPLLFGVFVIVPPQTWYGARTNAGYGGSFLSYVTSSAFWSVDNLFGRGDYFGGLSPAHLWFILFLWVISLAAIPLLAYSRRGQGADRLGRLAGRLARPASWAVVPLVLVIADALPDVGGKNPFFFLAFFALGFVVMHDERFAEQAERFRAPALAAGLGLAVATVALWPLRASLPDPSVGVGLLAYVQMLGAWLAIVGLIGYGRAYLDRPSATLGYLGESSYPVYILHQTIIVVAGFYLVAVFPHPALSWPVLIALSAALTFALYELVRRVDALRVVFGLRPLPKA